MQSQFTPISLWKRYARRADNVKVQARLVEKEGKKFLEVKENKVGNFVCPNCAYLLSQEDTGVFPNFFLQPNLFHQAHRPLDLES